MSDKKDFWISVCVLIGLGFVTALRTEEYGGGFDLTQFVGYLYGAGFGWVGCKVHYKVKELRQEVERLQDEVHELQAEVDYRLARR